MDSYAMANARLVEIRRLEAERDWAVEQRENANAATLRAEAERDRLRQALERCQRELDRREQALRDTSHQLSLAGAALLDAEAELDRCRQALESVEYGFDHEGCVDCGATGLGEDTHRMCCVVGRALVDVTTEARLDRCLMSDEGLRAMDAVIGPIIDEVPCLDDYRRALVAALNQTRVTGDEE